MNARRNDVAALFVGDTLCIPLTAARACRVADFELRHAVKIEQVILDFLDDQIFNTTVPSTESVGSAPKSHGRDQ